MFRPFPKEPPPKPEFISEGRRKAAFLRLLFMELVKAGEIHPGINTPATFDEWATKWWDYLEKMEGEGNE